MPRSNEDPMLDSRFVIKKNDKIAHDVYKMVLEGDTSHIIAPGQFVNIALNGFYLRRPLSICDKDDTTFTIIYKILGKGTAAMARLHPAHFLTILTGLGNGYDTSLSGGIPLLVGGGVGTPPLYLLAKTLLDEGKKPSCILGFNSACDVFYEQEFKDLGIDCSVVTVDGTYGTKGFVTDILPDNYSYVYTCGPAPMLKALDASITTSGQFSLEERMGCGIGACVCCTVKTKNGQKSICKDGPVFKKEELIWIH